MSAAVPLQPDPPARGKVPPHDVAAEEALIGAMLISKLALEHALTTVAAADFYVPELGRIFEACAAVTKAGQACDPTTVAAWLDAHDTPGTRRRLLELQAQTPASINAPSYAAIVIETAARRRLARAGRETTTMALDRTVELGTALERASELIGQAEIPLAGTAPETVAEFLARPIEHDWVWPGILERQERLLIVAPEKFGKSTLIRQTAFLLSQGLDPFRLTTIPMCTVLLMDLENPPSLIHRRLGVMYAAANTLEHPAIADSLRVECRPDGLDITERVDLLWLHGKIAAAREAWATVGWDHLPFILCIGPIYKLHLDELSQVEARKVQRALDTIRTRYDCALIMETHAPHESFQPKANPHSLRPAGPRTWLRWPDFCRALEPSTGIAIPDDGPNPYADFYDVQGARDERAWPKRLKRGGKYPWLEDSL